MGGQRDRKKEGEKHRRRGDWSEIRENPAQTSKAVIILACHLVVKGDIIQKEKLGVSC